VPIRSAPGESLPMGRTRDSPRHHSRVHSLPMPVPAFARLMIELAAGYDIAVMEIDSLPTALGGLSAQHAPAGGALGHDRPAAGSCSTPCERGACSRRRSLPRIRSF
jgi:hypothetical protein